MRRSKEKRDGATRQPEERSPLQHEKKRGQRKYDVTQSEREYKGRKISMFLFMLYILFVFFVLMTNKNEISIFADHIRFDAYLEKEKNAFYVLLFR